LIGELPIDESSFRELCDVIQQEWKVGGSLLIDCVPPALFVTTMVFTARYSDENARHFWQPYSQLVWGLDEAKQYFQNKCRDRFKASIAFLEGEFGFHFPRRSAGDVVQPIYRHAIIPFYLQNEFAAWLKKQWQNILDIPSELLVTQLCADSSLKSLSPTLRTFIESAETANAAAELIANIAQAAKMYAEGETLENISPLLAFNPTRQALWNEFAKIYADQVEAVEAVEKQRAAGSLCWVWSLDDHQMQLRLLNLTVQAGAACSLPIVNDVMRVLAPSIRSPYVALVDSRISVWSRRDETVPSLPKPTHYTSLCRIISPGNPSLKSRRWRK
jgi:hypothetical protein